MQKYKSFRPPILSNLLLSLLTLLFLLIIGEIFLRAFNDKGKSTIDRRWFEKHVKLNSLGYRDKEYSLLKNKEKFRILVLGDSMTFGSGINLTKNTIPKRLEFYLNKNLKQPRFEVISQAFPGYNTDSQLYELYINGFSLQPDMVFLAYYHNDIPKSDYLKCDSREKELLVGKGKFKDLFRQTSLYQFINFRMNRLLEKLKMKPTMVDCINSNYSSFNWEMEKVYLDAIKMACRLRHIKLMIGTIPLMFNLNEEYPIGIVHSKLRDYCNLRGLECIDFLEMGLKGNNADNLILSKEDRHLNENGAEIVARSLYQTLEPLTAYSHLPTIHRAFSLRELLEENNISKEVDSAFDQIEEKKPGLMFQQPIGNKNNISQFKVKKVSNNFNFNRTSFNSLSKNKVFTNQLTLDNKGQFISNTFTTYDPNSKERIAIDKLEKRENKLLLKITRFQPDKQKVVRHIKYKLMGERQDNGTKYIYLEDEIPFVDPKTLFQRLLTIPGNFRVESVESNEQQILSSFLFFHHYNWVRFMDALFEELIKRNPDPMILHAIAKTYRTIKNDEKLDDLIQSYPQFKEALTQTKNRLRSKP